jgi:hypothetical protein
MEEKEESVRERERVGKGSEKENVKNEPSETVRLAKEEEETTTEEEEETAKGA